MSRAREPLGSEPDEPIDDDAPSLDGLYRRHAAWLHVSLRRRLGPALAGRTDDLVQETYVRAAALQARGPIRHPRALLMQIAWRLALDLLRKRRRERAAQVSLATPDTGDDPEIQLVLKQTILSLPKPQRDVFVLSRFAGLSYEEIGVRLGVSVKTVEARMSKALRLCAASLRH